MRGLRAAARAMAAAGAGAAAAARGGGGTTVEIAPGIFMPYVSDGVIFDAVGETAGLERFLSLGGRGVDTAWSYRNQPAVGKAVQGSSVPRGEIFLTTKIECEGTAEAAMARIKYDLSQLGLAYADLVLIHAPYKAWGEPYSNCTEGAAGKLARQDTWRGMEQAVRAGLVRSIGLSNFNATYVAQILETAEIPPSVDQCQLCVGYQDNTTINFARAHGITYQAYSPLGGADIGGKSVTEYDAVRAIAASHNRSAAQVALRWVVQQGSPLATATGKSQYIEEDLDLFSWALSPQEVAVLNSIRGPAPP